MDLSQRIEKLLEQLLEAEGYGIVRIHISGNIRKILQIMIERIDDASITVEDCEKVSRLVSPILDVEDLMADRYTLEVSSPGLDRPLTKPKHFVKFQGHAVSLQTNYAIKNRKKFQGILDFASETGIKLALNQPNDDQTTEIELSYDDIRSARLEIKF